MGVKARGNGEREGGREGGRQGDGRHKDTSTCKNARDIRFLGFLDASINIYITYWFPPPPIMKIGPSNNIM